MKKLKKGENEKGTSKVSVITPVLQKADSLTGGPLQKNAAISLKRISMKSDKNL